MNSILVHWNDIYVRGIRNLSIVLLLQRSNIQIEIVDQIEVSVIVAVDNTQKRCLYGCNKEYGFCSEGQCICRSDMILGSHCQIRPMQLQPQEITEGIVPAKSWSYMTYRVKDFYEPIYITLQNITYQSLMSIVRMEVERSTIPNLFDNTRVLNPSYTANVQVVTLQTSFLREILKSYNRSSGRNLNTHMNIGIYNPTESQLYFKIGVFQNKIPDFVLQNKAQAVIISVLSIMVLVFGILVFCLYQSKQQNTIILAVPNFSSKFIAAYFPDYSYFEICVRDRIKKREICEICQVQMLKTDICKQINVCQHNFHGICLEEWFKLNNACPKCKYPSLSRSL